MNYILAYWLFGLIVTAVAVVYCELTDPETRYLRREIVEEHGLFGVLMLVATGIGVAFIWPYTAFLYARLVIDKFKGGK